MRVVRNLSYKVKTNVFIMLSDGKVVGGYSFPNEKMYGSVYSLAGKTLEEITGLSYNYEISPK